MDPLALTQFYNATRKEQVMNHRLVGYHEGTSFLHRLSGASKLLFLLFVSLAAMLSYDTRLLLGIGVGALLLFSTAGIRFPGYFICACICFCFCTVKCCHGLISLPPVWSRDLRGKDGTDEGWGSYSITSQELFYLFNLALQYVCTIPLALIFLMTTHPSQFASSPQPNWSILQDCLFCQLDSALHS